MRPFEIIVGRIKSRGITVAELSRRVNINSELLRRSLKGTRKLQASEFIDLCQELELSLDDFRYCPE